VLSDRDIRTVLTTGEVYVHPFNRDLIQPASLDLRLAPELRIGDLNTITKAPYVLQRGEFALASTLETITLPAHFAARVEGKSSHGRQGLSIHITAGFIDPGFSGQITLELHNVGPAPIQLHPDMLIAQLCLIPLSSPAERPYGHPELGSHYQGQQGPTPSRAVTETEAAVN
jgi:dCTP deaminase